MAKPTRSIEERRAALIDAQDHLSEEEKKRLKEEERKKREAEVQKKQSEQIAESLVQKAAENVNPLERGAQQNLFTIARQERERKEAETQKRQNEQIAANLAKKSAEKVNPLEKAAEQNALVKKAAEENVPDIDRFIPKNNGKQGLSDQIYEKILAAQNPSSETKESSVSTKHIPGTKQALSDSIFQRYLEAEKYYNSENNEDDFWKALFNRFRSVPGEAVEDFAFLLKDFLPGYKPAQDVVEKNTAGQIAATADRQIAAAKEKTGDFGDFGIDAADALTRMLSNAAFFGGKNIALSQGIGSGLGKYREQREEGAEKGEALFRGVSTGAAGYIIERLGGIGGVKDDIIKATVPGTKALDAGKTLSFIGSIGKNALEEGGEELAESVVNGVTDMIADMAFKGEVSIDFNLFETIRSAGIGALIGGGFGAVNYGANAAAEVPVPFDGKAEPGTEQQIIADKIAEIENRPISEAEKAAKMEEVAEAVAMTTGNPETVLEAEKFRDIHGERAAENINAKENGIGLSEDELGEYLNAGGRTNKNKLQALQEGKDIILTTKKQVSDYIKKAISGAKDLATVAYGKVTNRLANDVFDYSGGKIDVAGSYLELVPYDVQHAYQQHLNAKEDGDINLTLEDFENIPEYVNNYDDIVYAIKFGSGNTRVCLSKILPNGRVLLIETVSKSRGSMQFKNMIGVSEKKYIQEYENTYKKRNTSNSRGDKSPNISLRDDYVSNNIIPPVSGIGNPPSIGNNVFGAGILGNKDPGQAFEKGEAEGISEEITQSAKPPSMERANKGFNVDDWLHIAESINVEAGIWRMKDLARVLDSASGGNKVLRQQLYELYEKPLNEAQGTYAKNYAEKARSISEKFKELGIRSGSKESAAVQRIGEGVKEIDKKGNTVPYTLENLKTDFPDSWENIKEGADYCRKVYDEFLRDLNAMYSEIYPATVEQANERVSGYDKAVLGYAEKIDRVNEVKENLEADKAKKQAELSKKRPNTLIYAELQNQIANIDRKLEQADRIIEKFRNRKLAKEISRDTLKAQIENGEILKNKQIKPRKDYFRHFQELTDEFAEIADIFSNDQRIPPNLAGKSETTKPRTIWTSIAQSRGRNYYTEDAVGGLLRYTEIAEKLLVFDPLISHFRDANSAIRAAGTMVENEVKGKGTNAGQFASWADDVTNSLAGKTNKLDRLIADNAGAFGRATIKAIEALNHRVKSNAILGNFRSALVQIGNLPNATLYIQNPVDWTMGAVSLANPTPEIIEARKQSNFMNRRYMGDAIDELTREIQQNKILDKPKEFALWMLSAGDKAAAELIWHTAYSRAVRNPGVLDSEKRRLRGYENAVDYADDITRRSIGGRAEGDIPYWEESKITGLVAPFQIEVANTFNAVSEQIGKKNAAGLIGFEVGIWLINTALEEITGDRPLGFDYIDALWDIITEATGDDEEEKDLWDIATFAGGRLAGETLSSMPFGAQIGSIVTGGDEQKAEDWFGDSDPTRYGTGNIGMGALADIIDYFVKGETPEDFYNLLTDGKKNSYSEIAKPVLDTVDTFAPLLMPWGGKQLSRSLGGIDQLIQGGAYGENEDGRYLKFPQSYDLESILKTFLFGQYASDRGQQYIDSGFSDKLSAKQTEQMKIAEPYGISNEKFYDIVLGLRDYGKKADKQEALLENENLSEWEKNVMDYILFGNPTKGLDAVVPERDYSGEAAFYRSGLSDSGKRLFDAEYSREEIEAIEKAVKSGKNKAEEIGKIQKALDCTEAEAFAVYQQRNGDWIFDEHGLSEEDAGRLSGAADFYGMSTEDYLAVLNYSNYGAAVKKEDGTVSYSTSIKDVIPNIMAATGWDEETALRNYYMVNSFEYSREDIEEEEIGRLDTAGGWYEVEDRGYFVAKNAIDVAEGEKDEYGNTVSGSAKAEAIKNIAKQLGVDEAEATIYYLAANGDLVLSVDDLTSSHREDLETAISRGWTERQYLDAVNVVKASGASKKNEIIKALMDAGAPYAMAQGYYNLREDKDYYRYVGTTTVAYGMSTQKQADKIDYFIANYNSKGDITAEDLAKWVKATQGKRKKADYIAALIEAGAPSSLAAKIYALMKGYDKSFNNWYKENGG